MLSALAVAMTACAPTSRVQKDPVEDQTPRSTSNGTRRASASPQAGDYLVSRGDTLFGIAFRHGLDYREVARRNQIAPPYTIYPGQMLRLGASSVASSGSGSRRPQGSSNRSSGSGLIAQTASNASPSPAVNNAGTAGTAPPLAAAAGAGASGNASAAATTGAATGQAPGATRAPAMVSPPPVALSSGPVRWQWPASGQTVVTFLAGDPTRQGIGIAGSNGQSVHAAGDGVVVYSGAGLIGYGELVIIKHSDEWLSAYGHNRKRLVGEGQAVRAGQQIAEMGRSGASRDMLHFEIRRKGKPVDPMGLLPRR